MELIVKQDFSELANQDHKVYMSVIGSAFGLSLLSVMRVLMMRSFVRIYFEPTHGKFTGIHHSVMLDKKFMTFTGKHVEEVEPSPIFKDAFGNFKVKGQKFLVLQNSFTSPKYFALFRGLYTHGKE